MAEMTLLEAARYLETGGSEAVVLLRKAARTVMQHAGDMKKLNQERLVKEAELDEIDEKIEADKVFATGEKNSRAADVKLTLEKDREVLRKSKEEVEPLLQELASFKEQVENTKDILRETILEGDRIALKGERDLKDSRDKLTQVKEAIKQAKVDIGAL